MMQLFNYQLIKNNIYIFDSKMHSYKEENF